MIGEDDRNHGLGLLEDERLRKDLIGGGLLKRSSEQDRGQGLGSGRDDDDRQPTLPAEVAKLVRAPNQDREQEQRDQAVLGDHDLGRGQVTDQLVAEVGV